MLLPRPLLLSRLSRRPSTQLYLTRPTAKAFPKLVPDLGAARIDGVRRGCRSLLAGLRPSLGQSSSGQVLFATASCSRHPAARRQCATSRSRFHLTRSSYSRSPPSSASTCGRVSPVHVRPSLLQFERSLQAPSQTHMKSNHRTIDPVCRRFASGESPRVGPSFPEKSAELRPAYLAGYLPM